jgi:hypothetical protein
MTNTYVGGAHGNGTKRPWMICGAVPTRYSIYLLYQYKSTNTSTKVLIQTQKAARTGCLGFDAAVARERVCCVYSIHLRY